MSVIYNTLDEIENRLVTSIKKISEFENMALKIILKIQRKSLKINEQDNSELQDDHK